MIAAMGGYQFIHDDEMIFEKSASKDKDYVVIEGALHGFGPCTACEKTKGQYSNTVKNLFDYIGGRRRGTEANPRNKDDRGRRSARSYQSIRKKHQEGKCEVEEYGLGQEPEC
jgi:hypothetical protein